MAENEQLPEIHEMAAELILAGWTEKTRAIWRAPNGTLHLGPAGAWRLMKRTPRTVDEERARIIRNAMKLRVEIEQTFTDIASWNDNARKPGEPPIDADPNGDLRLLADGIDGMMKHEIECDGVGPIAPVLTPEGLARLKAHKDGSR